MKNILASLTVLILLALCLTASAEESAVYTPSHGSPYEGEATGDYWTLPMDITDEAAVWEALMRPITVVTSKKSKPERRQLTLRAEPDEKSEGVGMVTCMTQGVRVLETLDNGWSLVECYSSSFSSSPVKTWNMLVQGYVETERLQTVTPSSEYGIVVDKLTQRLYLFKEGRLYSTLLVSTGLANAKQPYNETRAGEFLLTSAVGEFESGNMVCDMAIRFNAGDLLHEVPYIPGKYGRNYTKQEQKLGEKASHGCIRVQRWKTPEGVNMEWLWDNRQTNTRLFIWEDWQGRQIDVPPDDLTLYAEEDGTTYHSQETCYAVADGTEEMAGFPYADLDSAAFQSLTRCPYCAPVLRRAEIEVINARYAPGGDHDPVLTEAREKQLKRK